MGRRRRQGCEARTAQALERVCGVCWLEHGPRKNPRSPSARAMLIAQCRGPRYFACAPEAWVCSLTFTLWASGATVSGSTSGAVASNCTALGTRSRLSRHVAPGLAHMRKAGPHSKQEIAACSLPPLGIPLVPQQERQVGALACGTALVRTTRPRPFRCQAHVALLHGTHVSNGCPAAMPQAPPMLPAPRCRIVSAILAATQGCSCLASRAPQQPRARRPLCPSAAQAACAVTGRRLARHIPRQQCMHCEN